MEYLLTDTSGIHLQAEVPGAEHLLRADKEDLTRREYKRTRETQWEEGTRRKTRSC